MKKVFFSSFLAMAAVLLGSRDAGAQISIHIGGALGRPQPVIVAPARPGPALPPGQMKKWYGVKSAKHFAPGQVKKHGWKKGGRYARVPKHGYEVYRAAPEIYPVRPGVVIDAHIEL